MYTMILKIRCVISQSSHHLNLRPLNDTKKIVLPTDLITSSNLFTKYRCISSIVRSDKNPFYLLSSSRKQRHASSKRTRDFALIKDNFSYRVCTFTDRSYKGKLISLSTENKLLIYFAKRIL
jgi:hypothetical protein